MLKRKKHVFSSARQFTASLTLSNSKKLLLGNTIIECLIVIVDTIINPVVIVGRQNAMEKVKEIVRQTELFSLFDICVLNKKTASLEP